MTSIVLNAVEMDKEGFLVDPNAWTPELAQEIASSLNIELTERHWTLINYARDDFAAKGQSPGLRRMTKFTDVGMKEIYKLFPKGPGKLIARVAGIPKPKSCL